MVYLSRRGEEVTWTHHSIGGRLESDGTFLGSRWRNVMVGAVDSDEAQLREEERSTPSPADVQALKALIAEVLRRSQAVPSGG